MIVPVASETRAARVTSAVREWFRAGDLPLLMPYLYILLLGSAIFALQSSLIDGPGGRSTRVSRWSSPLHWLGSGRRSSSLHRGIDLSVGGVISATSALLATHLAANGPLIVLELTGVIVGGVLVGCLNGFMIAYTSIQPFVVTLATWYVFDGVAFGFLPIEGGKVSTSLVSAVTGSVLGVPKSVCAVVVLFLLWRWLRPTRFITDLIAIGSDEGRARLLGVRVKRRKIQAYATCRVSSPPWRGSTSPLSPSPALPTEATSSSSTRLLQLCWAERVSSAERAQQQAQLRVRLLS